MPKSNMNKEITEYVIRTFAEKGHTPNDEVELYKLLHQIMEKWELTATEAYAYISAHLAKLWGVDLKTVCLKEYMSGDFAYDAGLPEGKSVLKSLGGKGIVRMSRYWCNAGIGGWITEWLVKPENLPKVKESVESFGYSLVLEKWDKEKEKYYREVY